MITRRRILQVIAASPLGALARKFTPAPAQPGPIPLAQTLVVSRKFHFGWSRMQFDHPGHRPIQSIQSHWDISLGPGDELEYVITLNGKRIREGKLGARSEVTQYRIPMPFGFWASPGLKFQLRSVGGTPFALHSATPAVGFTDAHRSQDDRDEVMGDPAPRPPADIGSEENPS